MTPPAPRKVIVVGGGIIGVSTAYFLSHHPSSPSVTIIEASSIASGASGKAGGLLALDWHTSDTASLARLSYHLHASLAEQYSGYQRWGYRELHTLEISCEEDDGGSNPAGQPVPPGDSRQNSIPSWVRSRTVKSSRSLGTPKTTAQIHPEHFCRAILQESKNVTMVAGYVTKIIADKKPLAAVEVAVEGNVSVIDADVVVVAAGPWTSTLLPVIPVSSQRAHSITVRTTSQVSPHALFTNVKMRSGSIVTPEIYPRINEVYACGDIDDLVPLPKLAKDVQVDQQRCKDIAKNASIVSELFQEGEITSTQAEIGPGPSIGWVPGMSNVAVAAGHGCWGICNGPGTGKVMSELICEGKIMSANTQSLDPSQYI
ncbi:hypothetical protein DRE_02728 [Drechslerella stenobrocha 248]|uniref:FAD dependent oxidoreductase domain-containing protein n=1 Tax=Drechslerella stenobrocha 248 TaxID=1043628 RepID=W7HUF8_9PEZI|nr:hypothetical protein DRE_02728 [Drechslerella stenobrocha 248]